MEAGRLAALRDYRSGRYAGVSPEDCTPWGAGYRLAMQELIGTFGSLPQGTRASGVMSTPAENSIALTLDDLSRVVRQSVPESNSARVGREDGVWYVSVIVHRRDAAFQVQKHRHTRISACGETFGAAIARLKQEMRHHETGTYQGDPP
jgi:hypothetical protein